MPTAVSRLADRLLAQIPKKIGTGNQGRAPSSVMRPFIRSSSSRCFSIPDWTIARTPASPMSLYWIVKCLSCFRCGELASAHLGQAYATSVGHRTEHQALQATRDELAARSLRG